MPRTSRWERAEVWTTEDGEYRLEVRSIYRHHKYAWTLSHRRDGLWYETAVGWEDGLRPAQRAVRAARVQDMVARAQRARSDPPVS